MKKILILIFIAFICYFFLLCKTTHQTLFPTPKGIFINDYWDRSIYFLSGSWYPLNKLPYKEVFSEYPPLATYLFALPFVFMPKYDKEKTLTYFSYDSFPSNCSNYPFVKPSLYKSMYMILFSLIMGIFACASVYLLLIFLKLLNKNLMHSLLFLFPATLFFTFNRFDILPSLIILISLYSMYRERYKTAAVLLGLGAMVKAFPLLLLPVYLVYYYSKFKKVNFKMVFLFALTVFLVILPILIKGGISAIWVAISFQLQRSFNYESVYYLLNLFFTVIFTQFDSLLSKIFLILSFMVFPFVVTAKIDSFKSILRWSLLSILIFMFFMKFYSPQWILWVIFLMILNIQNRMDIFKIILFQLITYLEFPVADVIYGQPSYQYVVIITIKSIILLSFIIPLIKDLVPHSKCYIFLRKLIFLPIKKIRNFLRPLIRSFPNW